MSLEAWELVPNSAVDVDGTEGRVMTTNAGLTSVSVDGKVSWYETSYVLENASVPEPPAAEEQAAPAATQVGTTTVPSAPVPSVNPATPGPSVPGPAGVALDPTVNPSSVSAAEQDLDAQIADAKEKLSELEAQKRTEEQSNPTSDVSPADSSDTATDTTPTAPPSVADPAPVTPAPDGARTQS